ncbi:MULTISPECIES: hypothetical protein [Pseudomonas]|uniref:hypothetical protein n=1 Tax=Pseudomonas TaxID=286 RepID=UPI0020A03BBD|nr:MULTISPECIES: hypothetical protein [Pseudomonas]MCP1452710.1 hypothetical protein [Pseudomonas kilonensis]UVM60857.1 hypothetical protein LOY50_25600 [Pseudomonas sp. B21-010]
MQVFNSVPFIGDGVETALDPRRFPYLFNDHGLAQPSVQVRGNLIPLSPENPSLSLGTRYSGISWRDREVPTNSGSYWIKTFDFHASEVHYAPIWATRETAQAFGMTLLGNGECLRFEYDQLILGQYTYGKWAGHQSPYLGPARQRELLTYNPTDLEYHDFPHAFFSRYGRLPLVISVARWRPAAREIYLADLWLRPGDALVLPPKHYPDIASSDAHGVENWPAVVDMHGNRNSALACWFWEGEDCLLTETILANSTLMNSPQGKPHYHEEKTPTRHELPANYRP